MRAPIRRIASCCGRVAKRDLRVDARDGPHGADDPPHRGSGTDRAVRARTGARIRPCSAQARCVMGQCEMGSIGVYAGPEFFQLREEWFHV
jgi:hypothetical protein